MNLQFLRQVAGRTVVSTSFGVAALLASPAVAFAQNGASLVGVWGVSATPRNCATNAALGPPLRSLITFHQDGTSIESAILLLFAPGQRSVGHGTWTHTAGLTYAERSLVLIGFETPPNNPPGSPGFPAGWTLTTHAITITSADRFESTGTTRFYDLNRQEYRTPACATRIGERFK